MRTIIVDVETGRVRRVLEVEGAAIAERMTMGEGVEEVQRGKTQSGVEWSAWEKDEGEGISRHVVILRVP